MIYSSPSPNFNPKMNVVGCFIKYKDKFLILHRQDNKPQGNTWCVPAGKIEKDESSSEAILREIKEETGFEFKDEEVNKDIKLYDRFSDLSKDFYYTIYGTTLEENIKIPRIVLDKNEHKDYKWVTPEEALKMDLIEDEDHCIKHHFKIKEISKYK